MHREQRLRAQTLLREKGIERALFASVPTVQWLTGFAPPEQPGADLFAGGPPLLWYQDAHFALIVLDRHAANTAALDADPDCSVVTYLSYTIDEPIEGGQHLAEALRRVLRRAGSASGPVGVEEERLPAYLWSVLRTELTAGAVPVAIDGWMNPLRAIKTDEELAKLRENFALTDVAHAAARGAVGPGKREIDIWTAIRSAVEAAAGHVVPLGNDCVVGHRQANIGGLPLDLEIQPHDAVIVDLSTLLYGYWTDSCATYYAGEPTARQVAMHRTVTDALDLAVSLVKPGTIARDIDRRVRQFIADAGYPVYPHHTGHGVGVTGHEEPRIVPYNTLALQEGMIVLLEPGIYYPGETGVRLEDALLVTSNGPELLTHHDKSLP